VTWQGSGTDLCVFALCFYQTGWCGGKDHHKCRAVRTLLLCQLSCSSNKEPCQMYMRTRISLA
jgi:hypothetical protein